MERCAAQVPSEDLNQERTNRWAQEIRDYLLGRLSAERRVESLRQPQQAEVVDPPVRRWWIFEGKQYAVLDGPLAQKLDCVLRKASGLLRTFNPRVRLSDRPDGVVDWGYTLARGPSGIGREYVVRSSGVGLDDGERAALCGWFHWIKAEWTEYTKHFKIASAVSWPSFACDMQSLASVERLRRWAHSARRSRWPLLNGVVAESLRPLLEPETLDRIPLPCNEAKLFELLCLVRIARCIAPPPRQLRWLSRESDNTINWDGISAYYQQSLDRDLVLATYEHELASAIEIFKLRIPRTIDLAFEFEAARAGFNGIIVEAKSGAQQYHVTVPQLRTYSAARWRQQGSRYLIWGIVEAADRPDVPLEELRRMLAAANKAADVWVFSSADAIPLVLSAALGTQLGRQIPAHPTV